MKLVAAKCPSCGANLDVNPDIETMKCQYCGSAILIDDAINKYKIEVSGQLTIENMPKLENYLKLGERYYNDGDYNDAHEIYSKAIELSPDHYIVVLRLGLTKTLGTGYFDFDINSALKGIKHAYNILKDENNTEEINRCIVESNITFNRMREKIIDFYNSNDFNYDGITSYVGKLIVTLNAFEYLNTIVTGDKYLKRGIITNIIETIDLILENKTYVTDYFDKKGRPIIKKFKLNYVETSELMNKKQKYSNEILIIEGKNVVHNNGLNNKNIVACKNGDKENNLRLIENILCYVMIAMSAVFILCSIFYKSIISCFVWIVSLLLFVPKIKRLVLNKKPDFNITIIILRCLLPFIGIVLFASFLPSVYEGKWIATDNSMLVELNDGNAEITLQNGIVFKQKYTHEYIDENIYVINIEIPDSVNLSMDNYTFQYVGSAEKGILCLMEKDTCIKKLISNEN